MYGVRNVFATIAAAVVMMTSSELRAQDFFEALFGPDTASPQKTVGGKYPFLEQSQPLDPARSRKPKNRHVERNSPFQKALAANAHVEAPDGFCVRTCDGYYFPLIKSRRATTQQYCDYACPSAPTAVYEGSAIETARNIAGEKYTSLPTAFSFRDKAMQKCVCNAPERRQDFSRESLAPIRVSRRVISFLQITEPLSIRGPARTRQSGLPDCPPERGKRSAPCLSRVRTWQTRFCGRRPVRRPFN